MLTRGAAGQRVYNALIPESGGGTSATCRGVTRQDREIRSGHRGAVLWLTGLSGSGKSTVAAAAERQLFDVGCNVVVLDGDDVRVGLSSDLGFSGPDRHEQSRRLAELARLFAGNGMIAIVAAISPIRKDRSLARAIVGRAVPEIPFVEVYLSAPLRVCEARDPKCLYARTRRGEIRNMTGISAPYEAPLHPDLLIDTSIVEVPLAALALMRGVAPLVLLDGKRPPHARAPRL